MLINLFLEAAADSNAANANPTSSIWLWVAMIVLVVLMIVMPSISNRKRQKEYNEMIEHLCVGDQVKTIGGIVGKITKINKKEDGTTIILETGAKGAKTTMEFDAGAIGTVLKSNYVAPVQVEEGSKKSKKKTAEVEEKVETEQKEQAVETEVVEGKIEVEEPVVEQSEDLVKTKKTTKKSKKK